jgi:hypothetical protein
MGKKTVALIACSNGYGHIRRLLLLSQALKQSGATPVLFVPLLATEIIAKSEGITIPQIVDFDTHTNKENWLDGTSADWVKSAPSFSDFDIVISDNLIEILDIRPDAWLSGSFFWHESLNHFPSQLKKKSLKLLSKYQPKMISSKMFSSNEIECYTKLYEVGLYTQETPSMKFINKKDALVACGLGGSVKEEAREFIKSLAMMKVTNFERIWVEPGILPNIYPDWMVPATFTRKMYQNVIAAVIRPGVGTVTSSLSTGARIFPFYERNNKEMELNALRVHSFGVGENTLLINDAWSQAELFRINNESQVEHYKKVQNLDMDGAKQAANIILSSI